MTDAIEDAATAVSAGELVVFPTETVYGLGADALDPDAIERVFEAKHRDRDNPMSLGVPTVEDALSYVSPTDRERAFMEAFLPGPVTVVCERRAPVPDALTGGLERVGVRVPDHDLTRSFLEQTGPVTATSANVSGHPSVTRVDDLDRRIRERAAVVLDGGKTAGTESTVVDLAGGGIVRRGALAVEIETWLDAY